MSKTHKHPFRYTMYADHHVECRANVAIRKGEEITDHYVSPLFGTMYRRSHLRDGWYFDCKCLRCQGKRRLWVCRILLVQTLNKKEGEICHLKIRC